MHISAAAQSQRTVCSASRFYSSGWRKSAFKPLAELTDPWSEQQPTLSPHVSSCKEVNSHSFPSPSRQWEEHLYSACDGTEVAAVTTCHTLSRTPPAQYTQSHNISHNQLLFLAEQDQLGYWHSSAQAGKTLLFDKVKYLVVSSHMHLSSCSDSWIITLWIYCCPRFCFAVKKL